MASVHELLTEQFQKWEIRGRGWRVFPEPVHPEPPFRPFDGHYLPHAPAMDDGRRPTILGSFVQQLSRSLGTVPATEAPSDTDEEELEPETLFREPLVELQTFLPASLKIHREQFAQFLSSLSYCREPITFELLSDANQVSVQFAVHPEDAALVQRQLRANFPDVVFTPRESTLEATWQKSEDAETAVIEFALAREFMIPLASPAVDPFMGIIGALGGLLEQERALYQVIFEPVRNPWAESVLRSVSSPERKAFFVNAPELLEKAQEKVSRPLYAAVLRVAAQSNDADRIWTIVREIASSLGVFADADSNYLIPLTNEDYPHDAHVTDLVCRQSRRPGMIINSEELIGFVHPPSVDVRSPKLLRQTTKTNAAPTIAVNVNGLILGENVHAGASLTVALTPEQRVRHVHLIGVSGTGKSTLLLNMISQGIEKGEGLAVLDPHGDLIDRILGIIPEERIDDVVLVEPSDEEYSIGFNILSAHSELEKNLLASDLVSVFQRLSTSWGDQMGSVLQNAILAFLESDRGGTLFDLRRFLLESDYRRRHLATVRDTNIVYYWRKVFPQLSGNKSIGPVLTRLDSFLGKKPIRHMVSQRENRLDFARIMDTGQIFLAKLSEGLLGKENSHLLGSLFLSKFQQLAMSRQAQQISARRPFFIFADEAVNFMTPSMAEILSGARKYRIGLTLAHHDLRGLQVDPNVASAVLSHPLTRIVFRVGDDDARKLSEGFSHFEAHDLTNLETGRAVVRTERSDHDFNLNVRPPVEPSPENAGARRAAVISRSREKYAIRRSEVEEMLHKAIEADEPAVVDSTKKQITRTKLAEVNHSPQTTSPLSAVPPAYKDLGKGGQQHRAIQLRLKAAAEELGFRATIEKQILDGQASVDLLLERPDAVIACQVAITNTVDFEVGNVRKSLKAGLPCAAVICISEKHSARIKAGVESSLGEASKAVLFYTADQLIEYLKSLKPSTDPIAPQAQVRHGYTVHKKYVKPSEEERKAREDAALKTITEGMKRTKKP